MTDVFAIQDEISQAIAEKLRIRLSGDGPIIKRHTENVEAYNLYLKARYHFLKLTPEGFEKCKEYCEQAIALDPKYALAWFGLADFYYLGCGALGLMPPKAAYQQCRQATLKTLELDELLPQAHSMMGALRAWEYDWKGAEQEFSRAFELDRRSFPWSEFSPGLLKVLPARHLPKVPSQRTREVAPKTAPGVAAGRLLPHCF